MGAPRTVPQLHRDLASVRQPADVPTTIPQPRRPATDAERRALASVVRLRILRLCLHESLTNKELADRLGRDPASVLHHVRTLHHLEFLSAQDPRPGPRGSTEVPYRATGKSWTLDFRTPDEVPGTDLSPEPVAAPDPVVPAQDEAVHDLVVRDAVVRTFLEEVANVPAAQVSTTRLGLQLTAEHRAEFDERVRSLLDEFVARGPDRGGSGVSVFLAVHPDCQSGGTAGS